MRCIRVSEFGGAEVLKLATGVSLPKVQEKQVLINVKAAGVNPVDTYIRNGTHVVKPSLPYTPGKDGAGIVQQVGAGVTKTKEGDRVWFTGSTTGSYAEYCVCNENTIGSLPDQMSFEDGAMLGIPYLTAYRALLQKAKVQKGENVLIHGATGGVGTAAIQICQSIGANVLGTGGSQKGMELLGKLGVSLKFSHKSEGYIEEIQSKKLPINVIIEMLADVNLEKDMQIIALNGRCVVVGSRGSLNFTPRSLMAKESTVTGMALFQSTAIETKEQIDYIEKGLSAGWVKPILWKTFPLEEVADAHREIIVNKGSRGQMILKI